MEFLLRIAFFALLIWVALVALLAVMQTSLLFPRSLVGPAPALPDRAETREISREGATLHGVYLPGRDPDRPLLLGFGGNAWNAADLALFLQGIAPDHPVAAFHFRGYAPSTGRPSAAALMADAEAIHDLFTDEGQGEIIAVGLSVGAGIAAHLAAERPLAGAVLVTPFDSLAAVARQSFRFAPVRLLFRHEMAALDALKTSDTPTAMIIATRDEVIPPSRAEALVAGLEAADHPPRSVVRLDARHNDIYGHPDFASALRDAITATSP